ncbi:4-nitrophenylphosphatase [Drosophila subpulchrella]|uniref:4-nitrophenylphosphatase n=1 Tax=Drosophila subpulchrella TaxID=1486046 RepID=UPI0018A12E2E|nr:4-nitrophenylphosphatase [Drosophila subpulchrella]
MSSAKHLKTLSEDELGDFFDSFDLVFCDCDGVVWYPLRDFIPGSAEALSHLELLGKQVTFVTNNSISSVKEHIEKFEKQGNLKIDEHQIVHPAQTICDHLRSINFQGLIYCLATPPFKELLVAAGFRLTEDSGTGIIRSLKDLHDAIFSGDSVDAVIIDVDFNLSAAKLMRAHVQLQNPKCLFLAGAADALIPFGKGEIIGPGAFIDVVSQSVGRQPTALGKPGEDLRRLLLDRHPEIPPSRVLFVGDSLASDIGFARASGYQTLLVLTGGTKLEDVQRLPADHPQMPDYLADCLGQIAPTSAPKNPESSNSDSTHLT